MSTAVACWNCGFENPTGAKFCANCGKPQQAVCPECGTPITEGARFCSNCGIPLKPVPKASTTGPVLTAETRKVVTILFADLVGSTKLTEQFDPEEVRDVVKKFYDVAQHVVERWFEGTIANYLGDGVLAVFGLPVAHEDDPERAVRAGLAIRDAMPVLNTHLAATHGVQLAVRIGINTGEVVAATGSTFERDFLVSDAVTTAYRLQETVGAGSVVVGERTNRLTRESIAYRELPPVTVKGKEMPLAVWAAVAPLPERGEVRRATAPLVGRHAELGLLRNYYERSRDEARVHLVTILGQPGVGKSRLLREFLAELRDTEPRPLVLRGRSVAFGGQIGYHALLDILRHQAGLMDTDPPEVVQVKLQRWLHQQLPDRTDLLDGLSLTFGTPDSEEDDPSALRQRLFGSWKELITALAASQPVVLAFEDLHWADEGLLELVLTLTGKVEDVPLFIICLARPELLERYPRWGGGLRNGSTIDLPPLRPAEAEQLVAALSSQGLAPDVRRLIAQRAEGNPLFVEELVRMMLEGSVPGVAIPDTVQAVLTARIDRLTANERKALQAAAVVGRSFWPSATAPIAGLTEDETVKAIDSLIAKELVVARPRSAIADQREYAFRHILTRDVAYNMLPKAQRQRAHAEAARWLEAQMGERVEEVIEILAEHMRVAGDERAVSYLHRAGNKARRLYANEDAVRFLDQALDGAMKSAGPPQQAAEIYRDRGEVRQLRGEYQAAMTDFEQALALAQQIRDRRLEARLESRIGLIHHRLHRLDEAQTHYSRAAALAREENDTPTLGRSLIDLANIVWDRGPLRPDDPMLTEGLNLLRQIGDKVGLARGLNMLCMANLSAGNGAEALAAAAEAQTAAHEAGDKSKEATSISYLSVVNGYLGNLLPAIDFGKQALALAEEIGDRRRAIYAHHFIGRPLMMLGRFGEAIQHLANVLPEMQELVPGHLPWPLFHLGVIYDEIGAPETAQEYFARAAAIDLKTTTWWQVIVTCKICLARLTNDGEALETILQTMAPLPWDDFKPSEGDVLLPIGESLWDMGRIEAVRRFVIARKPAIEWLGSRPYLAGLALLEARIVLHDRNPAIALQLAQRALEWSQESHYLPGLLRALELRVELTDADEDRSQLRAALQRLADSLPEQLRAIFLASPKAKLLQEQRAGNSEQG